MSKTLHSTVLGTWKDPFPGWLMVNSGNTGFIAGACKGVFRTVSADARKIADLIPSDVVVHMLLAAAWSLLQPE
jgi:fatty acyl-CoA reductase